MQVRKENTYGCVHSLMRCLVAFCSYKTTQTFHSTKYALFVFTFSNESSSEINITDHKA